MDYLSYYFIGINILNYFLFAIDKQKARGKQRRIPEFYLFSVSLLGGALGGILSMNIMKHKTKKLSFKLVMPTLLIVNILTWFYLQKLQ